MNETGRPRICRRCKTRVPGMVRLRGRKPWYCSEQCAKKAHARRWRLKKFGFMARNKTNGKFRNRSNEILFIDAREMGTMISRKQKELTDKDITKIADTYHNWKDKNWKKKYKVSR